MFFFPIFYPHCGILSELSTFQGLMKTTLGKNEWNMTVIRLSRPHFYLYSNKDNAINTNNTILAQIR